MYIDLHTHTTCSDGTLTPEALVQHAQTCGLQAVAITDHDTVAGNQPAIEEGITSSCEVVPGVELSATAEGTLHILGLFVDSHNPSLREATQFLQKNRKTRNLSILSRLSEQGIIIDREPFIQNAYLGRPHIAQALMDQGIVGSIDEAFQHFLKKGESAYVERVKLSPQNTLHVIRQAGGVSILAHPITLSHPEEMLTELLPCGLQGIEVYYPTHSPQDIEHFLHLAETYGLLVTGGSDFHGSHKPHIQLGCMQVPASLLEPVRKAHQALKQTLTQ